MALINCPNCQSIISNKAQKCPHCGTVFKKKRWAKKLLLVLLSVLILAVAGGVIVKQNLSEDYIWMPFDRTIERKDTFSHLSDEQIDMIEEYIPMVVEWYNDIDISEDIPYDFIDEDVLAIGEKLFAMSEQILNKDSLVGDTVFAELKPCVMIPFWVYTLFESYTFQYNEDGTISYVTIDEETWKEIGDAIRTAIDFYY